MPPASPLWTPSTGPIRGAGPVPPRGPRAHSEARAGPARLGRGPSSPLPSGRRMAAVAAPRAGGGPLAAAAKLSAGGPTAHPERRRRLGGAGRWWPRPQQQPFSRPNLRRRPWQHVGRWGRTPHRAPTGPCAAPGFSAGGLGRLADRRSKAPPASRSSRRPEGFLHGRRVRLVGSQPDGLAGGEGGCDLRRVNRLLALHHRCLGARGMRGGGRRGAAAHRGHGAMPGGRFWTVCQCR
jgi:hypothetical protein